MKDVLFATTALVALAGVTSAAADVSITGYTRFTYDSAEDGATMDPDYNLWIKADDATDTGLRYGGAVRVTPGDGEEPGSRHYMWLENELGKVIMGQHHGPAYTMSLGADWRGTVAAAGESSYNVFQGHTTPRVIYQSPNIAGFQVGTSVSEGTDSLGAETQTGLNYSIPFNDTMIKFGHSFSSVDGISDVAPKQEHNETGVEIKHGGFTASFLTFKREQSGSTLKSAEQIAAETTNCDDAFIQVNGPTGELEGIGCYPAIFVPVGYDPYDHHDEKVEGNEVELAYAVNDGLTVNVVKFKTDTTDADNNKSSYDRTSVGVKYTVAPGLTASLSQSMIDNAGKDEDAMKFRLNYSF